MNVTRHSRHMLELSLIGQRVKGDKSYIRWTHACIDLRLFDRNIIEEPHLAEASPRPSTPSETSLSMTIDTIKRISLVAYWGMIREWWTFDPVDLPSLPEKFLCAPLITKIFLVQLIVIEFPKATGSSLTHNYSRSQNEVLRDLHNGAQRINPENRVGSSFRIIPEQYFSGIENIDDFLENIDHNLAYYEIPAQLACAYLKGHLKGRALDWFEVLGYRVIEDKTTDYAHLKQALSEQFPVVRNRSELETRFYSSSQRRDQQPSNFIYELLKIHKVLKLEMSEEKLIDHVVSRLEPQILDYVEVRHPQNTANLLQIVDKYEERFMHRQIRGSSEGFRSSGPHEDNRFNTRHRQEN
ncbi:uncharacterized protein TNCV_3879051 [Trichonephila clavipes]|nr:uncharacterized protein TNCV_3879051 [Trichonephila clavipes]